MHMIAYEAIKKSIIHNELKPVEHISEYMLCEELGMSRTPVREALKVLASEGLVEIYRGVGIFVKHVTAKEVYEIFEVRAALEGVALQTSLANITDDELNKMEAVWLELKEAIEKGEDVELKTISESDSKFHYLIVEKCDNSFLKKIMKGIRENILRYQYLSATALGDKEDTINQHLEIINLIRTRELDKILPVLTEHIKEAADNIARSSNNQLF